MRAWSAISLVAIVIVALVGVWHVKRGKPVALTLQSLSMSERVHIKTADGVSLTGDYYAPATASNRGLLLVHMMPATRASWRAFAEMMQRAGFHVLAIDLRGHGESQGGPPGASLAKGGPDGYKAFSDSEHQASRADVIAASEFLKSKGGHELSLGGASIGANLVLQYLAEHSDAKAAFALSPGLDYRGVTTEPSARSLHAGKRVFYIASKDDAYSAESVEKLFQETPTGVEKESKLFNAAGHGTTIFEREPEIMQSVLGWLNVS